MIRRSARTAVIRVGSVCLALSLMAGLPVGALERTLADVEWQVAREYPEVGQLSSAALAEMQAAGRPLAIFDVRENAEYRVSRIPGAVRVDPRIWHSRFLALHGAAVDGKDVVFYCSVGARSSRLAKSVGAALEQKGARAVYNLEGGIFRWHNDSRSLLNDAGPTAFVHPYDPSWGKLVLNQRLVRNEPDQP